MSLPLRLVSILLVIVIARAVGAQPARQFIQIRDDVYRIQEGDHATVVLIGQDAILIADPLSVSAGRWLRDELTSRFPGKPVRYVVYTSHVFERAAGAAAFPEATFVGHANFNSELLKAARTLPASLAPLDSNRNERLESVEWSGSDLAPQLSAVDANRDGVLTSREVYRIVSFVRTTFRDRATFAVGSRKVEVVNPRGAYTTPALFFPGERVLYTGTNPAFASGGFSLGDANPRDISTWLRGVAALPFDTVVTGGGHTLTRATFMALARYVEDLFATASETYTRGLSVQEAAAAPALQKYVGTVVDTRRRANIEAIFRSLRVTRTELQGAGIGRWMSPHDAYCVGYETCSTGDRIAGGSGGIRLAMSQFGAVLEVTLGEQFLSQREGAFDDEAFAQRSSRGSLLFRYGATRPTARSFDLLAGATLIVADTRGVTRVKQVLAPVGGRHPFAERTTALAFTAGVNLVSPVTRAISIIVPVRVTVLPSPPVPRWPGRVDVQGGVGFSFRMTQRVR